METAQGQQIRIKGKVQGVGFRPQVWRLARQLALCGDVANDGAGVTIRLWADKQQAQRLVALLQQQPPPLAQIDEVHFAPWHCTVPPDEFTIKTSEAGEMATQIVADAAVCRDCLAEMNDPTDRHWRYPFINCTHCGPRFTLIRQMPYDRANTAMADFPLCPQCATAYRQPANRRFHAQPVACPQCGPQVWLAEQTGHLLQRKYAAIESATDQLLAGKIVALKGLGGFHLACDATDQQALRKLRQRKQRPSKPLAVMMADMAMVRDWLGAVTEAEEALLHSAAAPIVLMHKRVTCKLSELIAPGLNEVGIMLPATPLHHLLMQRVLRPLVMTSANASGAPPALENQQALQQLAGIADYWLLHNRPIVQRADDSVVRHSARGVEVLRRARGHVPDSLPLPAGFAGAPTILAVGADQHNTFCLLRGNEAVLSQHFGDLGHPGIRQQQQRTLALFQQIWRVDVQRIAVDAHPDYHSRQWGEMLAQQGQLPLETVLHHHAHLAACLGEHGWPLGGGPVLGLALDGLGYGAQGALWGGECLLVDYRHCRHLGGLPPVPLPGGDLAARQPWRNLLAQLHCFVPEWQRYPEAAGLPPQVEVLTRAMERGINSPLSSSAGRLFDAIAAALNICPNEISWQGEAACRLEALAWQAVGARTPVTLPLLNNQLDFTTFWQQWLGWRATPAERAWAFHHALAQGLVALLRQQAQYFQITTVAMAGGVLHNRLLRELLCRELAEFTLLLPSALPAGDGAIAFGQALITAARTLARGKTA